VERVCVEITEAFEGFVRGLIDVEPETKFDPQDNIYLAYRQMVRLKCSFTHTSRASLICWISLRGEPLNDIKYVEELLGRVLVHPCGVMIEHKSHRSIVRQK